MLFRSGARRLWKLRYDSCRLVELEQQVLGFERHGDVAGALIPALYFEYLRSGALDRLASVFYHNGLDILTLACLTGIVPYAFNGANTEQLKHPAEMAGIARWLRQAADTASEHFPHRAYLLSGTSQLIDRLGCVDHVFCLKQTCDARPTRGECAEHQRAMRDGFVARHAHCARKGCRTVGTQRTGSRGGMGHGREPEVAPTARWIEVAA